MRQGCSSLLKCQTWNDTKTRIVFDTNLAMHISTVVAARVRRWFRQKLTVFQR